MPHIYGSELVSISSNNGLSIVWCQGITWTNAGLLSIGMPNWIIRNNSFDDQITVGKWNHIYGLEWDCSNSIAVTAILH